MSILFKRPHSFVYLLILSIFCLAACSDNSANSKSNAKAKGKGRGAAKSVPVEVGHAEIGTAASYYLTTATIEPSSDAQIYARGAGVVRQIFREEGDDVKAGEILLQLEDDDQKLRLKQAKQKLASAEREFNRLNKMRNAGAVSPNEWEVANTNYLTAQTDLELAELALSYTKVAAPFDGRLVWRDVDLGAHVLNGNLLFRVMAIDPLLVRVHVPANRIGKVAKGQLVDLKVDSTPDTLQGVIDLVSPIVDPTTGTVKVTVRLDQYPASVRPGDFTEVKMITDQRENALLLPSVALIEERGQYYLFVEENNKAVRKNIVAGYIIDDKTEVVSGISQSDKIVVKGQRNLNEGNDIRVLDPEAKSPQQAEKDKPKKKQGRDS
ncbi:efflux RND transporter periplasmic adaptor subunit [Aliikangiella coralliicola]|uniref:Efflux RND transporter periplasmic adaptor subunit n=1 Tax=Aliikangiella coralliicola TaxID=2592383 RepID=A0A545U0H4_9GAMM|nr:efflux RND transporter periplasmic adaptor subunit [Aliikangiella coralliicola]TQV82923.1 efflux RND transporter periplasmic adaptor subunit [Aliikangiella coralliicola]